jgi:hypothetical protein
VLESSAVEFHADYGASARFNVRLPVPDADGLLDRPGSATSGRVDIEGID